MSQYFCSEYTGIQAKIKETNLAFPCNSDIRNIYCLVMVYLHIEPFKICPSIHLFFHQMKDGCRDVKLGDFFLLWKYFEGFIISWKYITDI